ncbi:hypothetical protein NGM10_03100 [Halorussus salilacus]|uniref:hypothetical protein n=1 Tax=Halorussus salilacus TaxID=2953750 RepID=UPI00209F8001|nr:hypothetical protein [Halorussus salilacus]USZ68733.1 hypothetical protein NGM10_03100 [Halorussus salilacus]
MTDSDLADVSGYADEYRLRVFDAALAEFGLHRGDLLDADAPTALAVLVRQYVVGGPGGSPRSDPGRAAGALERALGTGGLDPEDLWRDFAAECERANVPLADERLRDAVTGLARLVEREGNPFRWVEREVDACGRLTVPDDELDSLAGLGPDGARAFLRDAVWLVGVEGGVRRQDRHLLQSVGRWVRPVVEALWPSLDGADEVVLANHVADACADAGVSGVAFNQGAWYLGREAVGGGPDRVRRDLRRRFGESGRTEATDASAGRERT